jgi:hypothetical protein
MGLCRGGDEKVGRGDVQNSIADRETDTVFATSDSCKVTVVLGLKIIIIIIIIINSNWN